MQWCARPDARLAFVDHALFAGRLATGLKGVMQCVWAYEHVFDFDRLFATVGSEQRRQLLCDTGIEHVYDSRSLEFADLVRCDTQGCDVDIVLNSVTGATRRAGFDIYGDTRLGLFPFRRKLAFYGLDLGLMTATPGESPGLV